MNKVIVLIEDEEILLQLLCAKLESAGFIVHTARDGITGFGLVSEIKPDLVLLDMLLPGLNGMRILEKMKEEGLLPAIPVLIISNSGQPVELERALELGARDYLIKVNFNPQEVLSRAMGLLGTSPPSNAGTRGSHAGTKVLIVEDDVLLADLLEQKFIGAGYEVYRALGAEHARQALVKTDFAAILLDVIFPGTDGLAFLAELKRDEKTARTPILIISNLGQREEIDKGLRLGATDYVVKSNTSPAEIVERVTLLIQRQN